MIFSPFSSAHHAQKENVIYIRM